MREPNLDLLSLAALDVLLVFFLSSLLIFGPVTLDSGELEDPARVLVRVVVGIVCVVLVSG